ncbi:formylglycine-generating enzyme family protein [Paracoccus seriniphilus]|uniref:Formylglycine-generating enzyme, required for sulfatase activity, contains SUMF1/FGE domain n=1 Tax=Paracoccus seriniphilus TaxID=184748 RepID=A0A239Q1Q3_9RHOB|nr:formylglycine-generating enzyme family protein [Paracoccus seriniphilus]WCR16134.1 formylglycine-generating enzyme family protein [Paracoccus seriniphilus]SNT76248.1 Formylglycine-generating enzyme, required for sulfatase activity, contains SUMF1/FGE domain [Paracoccus seriniphilus]
MTEDCRPKACCGSTRAEMGGASQHRDAEFLRLAQAVQPAAPEVTAQLRERLKPIPGGIYEMGARKSTYPADLDSPRRKVKLRPFLMSPFSVTNADYARFVEATGYRTVAEQEGWTFVFHLLLPDPSAWPESPPGLHWWRRVDGACWSAPEGPGTDISGREDHPVTHVAWYDALAYCNWSGLRLPTEAEWERAARGGLAKRKFPWGDEMKPGGEFAMNTFQGEFPMRNTGEDGWIGTAPVDAFRPNGYGMYNMTGNVWEWVADLFGPRPPAGRLPDFDPRGADSGYARVQRGGSYLCHASYCDRYHVHSRTRNDPDSSTGNCGFRVASDIPDGD